MDNTREKLIELLRAVQYQGNAVHGSPDKYIQNSELADHLIANGVTFAKDTNVLTKADRIRAMSDEELAGLLAHEVYRVGQPVFEYLGCGITEEVVYVKRLKWLKQPVEEEQPKINEQTMEAIKKMGEKAHGGLNAKDE